MGWGRMLLLGDIGQQMDLQEHKEEIAKLRAEISSSASRMPGSTREIERLAAENRELKLYIATIFRILVSRKVVEPAELRDWIRAVDGEDGNIDNARSGDVT